MNEGASHVLSLPAHLHGRPHPHPLRLHCRFCRPPGHRAHHLLPLPAHSARPGARVSSELAAARSVQELMIPQEQIKTPGFEVDSVYNPANEVGGDFYHVESTARRRPAGRHRRRGRQRPQGGHERIHGDGRAAPHHRTEVLRSILSSLNRVLVGSESFTTCQAALFSPNGELVIANAGHLPPYLNSQEIALPGGLPLGVIPDVQLRRGASTCIPATASCSPPTASSKPASPPASSSDSSGCTTSAASPPFTSPTPPSLSARRTTSPCLPCAGSRKPWPPDSCKPGGEDMTQQPIQPAPA